MTKIVEEIEEKLKIKIPKEYIEYMEIRRYYINE